MKKRYPLFLFNLFIIFFTVIAGIGYGLSIDAFCAVMVLLVIFDLIVWKDFDYE